MIGVVGCGNVGLNHLRWLLTSGFEAIGYDTSPVVQQQISAELGRAAAAASLDQLRGCTWVHVCVPTDPLENDRGPDLSVYLDAIQGIAEIAKRSSIRGILQRSTCPPGTADQIATRLASGLTYGVYPSFIRKSTVEVDTRQPERIAIGGSQQVQDHVRKLNAALPENIPIFATESRTAVELLKYIENAIDAVLISLWNEFGAIADYCGLDATEFLTILEQIGARPKFASIGRVPGKAFGLWCLPKDLDALIEVGSQHGLDLATLEGAARTNERLLRSTGSGTLPGSLLFDRGVNGFRLSEAGRLQVTEAFSRHTWLHE